MAKHFKELTDYLLAQGVEQVGHTGKSYLAHLIGVYKLMEAQGCPEELCRAGMFHSIYGTERFQGFKLSLERREEVRALIGERAERLAYLNCAMDRASFDRAVKQLGDCFTITDRLTGEEVPLSRRLRRFVSHTPLRLAGASAALPRMGLSARSISGHGRAFGRDCATGI
jgi:hypothetical protein